jgi:hypothetical protein
MVTDSMVPGTGLVEETEILLMVIWARPRWAVKNNGRRKRNVFLNRFNFETRPWIKQDLRY